MVRKSLLYESDIRSSYLLGGNTVPSSSFRGFPHHSECCILAHQWQNILFHAVQTPILDTITILNWLNTTLPLLGVHSVPNSAISTYGTLNSAAQTLSRKHFRPHPVSDHKNRRSVSVASNLKIRCVPSWTLTVGLDWGVHQKRLCSQCSALPVFGLRSHYPRRSPIFYWL